MYFIFNMFIFNALTIQKLSSTFSNWFPWLTYISSEVAPSLLSSWEVIHLMLIKFSSLTFSFSKCWIVPTDIGIPKILGSASWISEMTFIIYVSLQVVIIRDTVNIMPHSLFGVVMLAAKSRIDRKSSR